MEKKLDFDLLFKKQKTVDITRLEIFRKSALLYWLDPDKELLAFDKNEINQFKTRALKNLDATYRLNDEDRREVLQYLKSTGELQKEINSLNRHSTYTDLLENLAGGKNLDVNEFSNEELYYGIYLADIFPDLLNKELLLSLYQRQQFFKQFARITQNFAGRKKELERINNYLDWLPKSGFRNKISQTFRNIINWHDKPPLLIKGIGGIGKSTIVAQVILNQNNKNKNESLPFVYVDFDLPGFSLQEPLMILIEALRQISIQYPRYKRLIQHINERITDLLQRQNESLNLNTQSSNASTRIYIYDVIQDIIKDYNLNLDQIGRKPIFVVFDSFEEMQYRASSTEMFTFFHFIKEVAEILPRVRPVFVGRAELNTDIESFSFETMEIEAFDEESAHALLEKKGIFNLKDKKFIYNNFGGNPLMLNLATDLAKKEGGLEKLNTEKIKGKKWQYLVHRILGHIHNDRVRKIAVPGMLVRYIDIKVIQEVLAEPTGLGFVDSLEGEQIYEELRNEVALISKSNDGTTFAFRQDLRMMCETMILEQYPNESRAIRGKAIDFYSKFSTIEDVETRKQYQAEYYFHLLKMDEIPEELDALIYKDLRPYLEHSIIELPAKAQRIIHSLNHQISSGQVRQSANLNMEEWEVSNIGLVHDALHGELDYLDKVYQLLKENRKRINNGFSEFGKSEALLYQRINKIELSQKFIDKALDNAKERDNPDLYFEFQLLQIQNFEYEERYKLAFELCTKIKEKSINTHYKNQIKFNFLFCRIQQRLNKIQYPENLFPVYDKTKYDIHEKFYDTKWEFIFNKLDIKIIQFKHHSVFNNDFRRLRKSFVNLTDLESYSKKHLGYFLKDITFTGNLHIVLRDVLYIKEIIERNSKQL